MGGLGKISCNVASSASMGCRSLIIFRIPSRVGLYVVTSGMRVVGSFCLYCSRCSRGAFSADVIVLAMVFGLYPFCLNNSVRVVRCPFLSSVSEHMQWYLIAWLCIIPCLV
ncbi:hypothetical protein FKM82_020029 [Ascaphus truei]